MKKIAIITLIGIVSLSANYSMAGCGSTIPHSYTSFSYPVYHPGHFIHHCVVPQPCEITYYSQYPSPVFYIQPPVLVEQPVVVQTQPQVIPQAIPQVVPQVPGVVNQFQVPQQVPQQSLVNPMVPQGAGTVQNQPQFTPPPQVMPQPGQPQGGGQSQLVPEAPKTMPLPQGGQPQLQNQVMPQQPQASMSAPIEAQARPITVPPAPNTVNPQPIISQSNVFGPPVIQ